MTSAHLPYLLSIMVSIRVSIIFPFLGDGHLFMFGARKINKSVHRWSVHHLRINTMMDNPDGQELSFKISNIYLSVHCFIYF